MDGSAAMTAFWDQERRQVTENIRRFGVHLTYIFGAQDEDAGELCRCCRGPGAVAGEHGDEAESGTDSFAELFVRTGGDRALLPPRTALPFCYTTGLFGAGHAELVVLGLGHEQAAALLNQVTHRVLDHGMDLTPGELLEVEGRSLLVEELHLSGMILFGTHDFYERPPWEPLPAHQLTWADEQGRFPWDDGHDPGTWWQPRPGQWRA